MLDKVGLTNFKAFQKAELPLGRFTLLSGLNSSGKSTVLQALALLRQSYESGALVEGGGFLLNGNLVELGVGQDVRHEEWVPTRCGDGAVELSIWASGTSHTWAAAYETDADLLPLVSGPGSSSEWSRLPLFGRRFQYLRADRITPAVSYPRSHDIAVRRGFLGSRGEHTVNYLRHHQDEPIETPELRHPQAAAQTLLAQVEAWLWELCPGVNVEASGIDGTDSVRLSFRSGTAGLSSTNPYRPTNVGFGLTYALPVVVACLISGPGSLVLMENPESHLHPRGQTAMARLACQAAATGAQIIIETHSDHVLNGARLAVKQGILPATATVLHYFRAGTHGAEVVTPTINDGGMLSEWPDGFFDEWDRSLDQLLD